MGNTCCQEQGGGQKERHTALSEELVVVSDAQPGEELKVEDDQVSPPASLEKLEKDASASAPNDELHSTVQLSVLEAFSGDPSAAWVKATDVQRMLVATEGDAALAKEKLKQAVRWRKDTLEEWLPRRNRLVNVVAIGDRSRPLVWGLAAHQRSGDVAAVQWASTWETALQSSADPMVQFDHVLDMSGFQTLLNLNVSPLLRLAPAMDSYFAERCHRLVVIDMPTTALFIWRAVRVALPPKTVGKIRFISRDKPQEMDAALYELASSEDMRRFMVQLVEMGRNATPQTPADPWHRFIDGYMQDHCSTGQPNT